VLIHGPHRIFDSTVIKGYIDERCPDRPLLPSEPAARAFARITEDIRDTYYEAVNWTFSEIFWFKCATGEHAEKLKAEAARQTKVLQACLTVRLGASLWFGGETFRWADPAVAAMVNRSVRMAWVSIRIARLLAGMPGFARGRLLQKLVLSSMRWRLARAMQLLPMPWATDTSRSTTDSVPRSLPPAGQSQ
jgi:glutathione S-transferase